MRNSLKIICLVSLLLILFSKAAYAEPATEAPPLAQTLVREGDFAVKLAEALKLESVSTEAEAESVLAAAGIAPRNGWIANYPMTPDVVGELRGAVEEAAKAERLPMSEAEAVQALQALAAAEGLPVVSVPSGGDPGVEPVRGYGPYSDATVVNNYYYNEGPPAVTYYPPPWDYYYMYSWVPYPFRWHTFYFPGFFVLHDFHRVVFVNKHVTKVVSNHAYDPAARRAVAVDPVTRTGRRGVDVRGTGSTSGGFISEDARRGAAAIVERSRERVRSGSIPAAITNRGTSVSPSGISGSGSRRGEAVSPGRRQNDLLRGTGSEGGFERRRFEAGPNERGGRSLGRPDISSGNRGRMALGRSPETGRSSFDPGNRSAGSFRSFSGSSGSFSRSNAPAGGSRTGFERSSPRMDRSFSAPSIQTPSSRGSSPGQGFRGGGGNSGRSGFAGGGSSRGGGCRGRC
jgi:hypothetical protein